MSDLDDLLQRQVARFVDIATFMRAPRISS